MTTSKAKKLTAKELKEVKELQSEMNNVLLNIGNAEVVKNQLVRKQVELQTLWDSITGKLEKKYGSVNISLEDGSLSPAKEKEVREEVYEEA
mgnify:FL=1|tara:strand:- start:483 stop:758 length:276 start_codon:yes stop_codon:yes gene_type:complete